MSSPVDTYLQALRQTLLMVGVSSAIAIGLGLLLAVVLTVTSPRGLYARPGFYRLLSIVVNIFRAIPFIILLVVLLPEALPGIIGGMTICVIAIVNASAMAGAVGAGGLGDLAIRYGYERYETRVMFEVIVILVALVSVLQFAGEWLARRVDHKR